VSPVENFSIASDAGVSSPADRLAKRPWQGAKTTMLQRSMNNAIDYNSHLSDAELLNEVKQLTADEVRPTSRLVAALGELDARRLYLGEGCASLFTYCTQVLHLSEHAADLRIGAARPHASGPRF
jgi:hypothetical protein